MMKNIATLSATLLGILAAAPAGAGFLWDNNIEWDRDGAIFIGGKDLNQRVVDDFVVPDGPGWRIRSARFHLLIFPEYDDGGVSEIYFHSGDDPGNQVFSVVLPHERVISGTNWSRGTGYYYSVSGIDHVFEPGVYWIGVLHPNATEGDLPAAWYSSDGLPDGPRRPAHWSRPGEEGWIPWFDRTVTFEIHGEVVPEPVTG
ncbi:MAG: hypothetical protein AB1725_10090, partial [Armatimonadota bacterium]